MTTEDSVRVLIVAASEEQQPRPTPVEALIHAGRRARRRRRGLQAVGIAAAVVPLLVAGGIAIGSLRSNQAQPAGQPDTTSDHGSLSDQEFAVAVAVARQETDKLATSITSATATVTDGTVTDSNTGHQCTSGTLLHIELIGEFNTDHAGSPGDGADEPVSAVLITADPESEQACLISVQTGDVAPDPGAAVLFMD